MAEQAQVTSVDAIAAFRASLVLYLNKTRPAVEQVNAEAMRTRIWVQTTQRQHWENERRLRRRKLEQAKEELFSARLSQFSQSTLLQTMAVQRAERAVEEAEGKLALLKKWSHERRGCVLEDLYNRGRSGPPLFIGARVRLRSIFSLILSIFRSGGSLCPPLFVCHETLSG